MSEEVKIGWLRRATVLAQPSHKEGWGLTVLEANACGTPVVATAVPGLRDSVRDGKTGLLVAGGDPAALADGLVRILEDQALRAELSRGALAWARRFRWDDVADAFAEVATAVAARRPLPPVDDFLADGREDAAPSRSAGA